MSSAQPSFPDLFHGDLTVNGNDAPDGVEIVTKVDGEFSGNITTEQVGQYGYSDSKKKQLAVSASSQNEPVEFYVRTADGSLSQVDSQSQDVDYRAEGDIRQVDLTFNDVSIVTADAGGDYEVDEGNSAQLSGSSSGFDSPSYKWTVTNDPTDSVSLNSRNSKTSTFNAPNVNGDKDVTVRLKVTDGQNSKSASNKATVTVVDTDSNNQGSSGSGGAGAPGTGQQPDDQPETPEPVDVQAVVDNATGSASASANASEGQTVTVTIPEQVDENVTQEVEGEETSTEVESVSATASGSGSISVTVSKVRSDEVQERKENQISYSNIEVEGETSNQVITFSVKKSVLEERNATASQVVKERYVDGSWEQLDTRIIEELDDRYRFEAETGGNSIFAVAIQDSQVEEPVDGNQTETNQTDNNQTDTPEEPVDTGMGVMPWVVGLLVILLAGVVYFREEITDFVVEQVPDDRESSSGSDSDDSGDDSPVEIVDDEEEEEKDQESDDSDDESSEEDED